MVFSFFKKPTEKMPERPPARPKPLTSDASPPVGAPPVASAPASVPILPNAANVNSKLPGDHDSTPGTFRDSIFGEEFTLSKMMAIEVENDIDPAQVDIEQAAVLFANGQDVSARAILENAARTHSGDEAERLWRMLLDLLQVLGDRTAFDKIGMEFAQVCEKSAPTWRHEQPITKPAANGVIIVLQGVITGSDAPGFAKLREALDKRQSMQINLGKLVSCDDLAAGILCELFKKARKLNLSIALDGADGLIGRLEDRLISGKTEYENGWHLLLELYQLLGLQELYDEKAVDYAVTFEVSPPSWETVKAGTVKALKRSDPASPADEAFTLSGECKNMRMEELRGYLDLNNHPIIDCSHLKRLDFNSAGALRNLFTSYAERGTEIIIRHPHHLVAELMNIVGIDSVARIIVTKF